MLLSPWLLGLAYAAPSSVDIELLRPSFAPGATAAVLGPAWGERGLRLGALTQYELDPLVLHLYGFEVGAVVHHRQTLHLGAWAQLSEGLGLRAHLPIIAQWGSEVPSLAADGLGWGDLDLGASWTPLRRELVSAGLRADASLPFGRREAWMGEGQGQAEVALTARAGGRYADLTVDLGAARRQPPTTRASLTGGAGWLGSAALRVHPLPDRAAVYTAVLGRGTWAELGSGTVHPASELLVGAQLDLGRAELELGLGRGLTWGAGTTESRAWLGLTLPWARVAEPEPTVRLRELPQPDPDPAPAVVVTPIPEPAPEPWEEGELARIQDNRIVLRDPIQFEYGTERILPESQPVLDEIARVMNQNARITHLLVEGHASEEGSFEYNYELSNRRAQAVWRALIQAGVHPDRLSYRGLGEVRPTQGGSDASTLAANRRVELRIVQQLGPEAPLPTWEVQTLLPWSGEVQALVQPTDPTPPPAPTTEQVLDELLNPSDFTEPDEDTP